MALAMGPTWEVRFDGEEGTYKPPFVGVMWTTPEVLVGPSWLSEYTRTIRCNAYPGPQASVADAEKAASDTSNLLYTALRIGVDKGKAMRIPLYNYDGLALTAPATDVAHRPSTSDFLRVTSLSIEPLAEPTDKRLMTVLATMRLNWRRPTVDPSRQGPLAQSVKLGPTSP